MTAWLRSIRHAYGTLDRDVGGDDHIFGVDSAAIGSDTPAACLTNQSRAGLLKYPATAVGHRLRQADQILRWIELRLIGETKRRSRAEGQRCAIKDVGVQPNLACCLRFGHDILSPVGMGRECVGVLPFQVASDAVIADPIPDPFGTCRIRVGCALHRRRTHR